jgi:hypothetical protein
MLTSVRFPTSCSSEGAQGSNSGELSVTPEQWRCYDGLQGDTGNPMVTTASLIASRRRGRGRLELCRAAVSFGLA